jgi:insulysin
VEIIRKASLEDVVKYFDTYINPNSLERRKISVHLRSQNVPNQPVLKFSVAASNAYLEVLKSHNIPVEEEQYNELSKAEPPVEAVEAFWMDHLSKVNSPNVNDDVREKLLKAISQLATIHAPPAVDTSKAELQKGTSIIENIGTFKASLLLGPAAVPLAVSKL